MFMFIFYDVWMSPKIFGNIMLTLRSCDHSRKVMFNFMSSEKFREHNVNVKIMIRYTHSAGHVPIHRGARGICTGWGGGVNCNDRLYKNFLLMFMFT